jgi:hypothetical protein
VLERAMTDQPPSFMQGYDTFIRQHFPTCWKGL